MHQDNQNVKIELIVQKKSVFLDFDPIQYKIMEIWLYEKKAFQSK